MGIALILLGLLAAGVVVDFVIENDLSAGAADVSLLGGSFSFSESEVVVGAALLGGFSVLLVILGVGFLRGSWGRRKALRYRVKELEAENAALRTREQLAAAGPTSGAAGAPPDPERIGEARHGREEAHAEGS